MKFIITEAYAPENVGSMALIENAVKIAKSIDANSEITVFAASKEGVRNTLAKKYAMDNIEVTDDFFLFPESCGKITKLVWGVSTLLTIIYTRLLLLFTKKPYRFLCGRRRNLFN